MKTVRELANELGVSKVRIQQIITKLSINEKPKKVNGKYILNSNDISIIRGHIDIKKIEKKVYENNDLSITFQKVIDKQNEQIKEKDKQIEKLQQLLENQQILTLNAQKENEQIKLNYSKKENTKNKWIFWK